jgi:hypothetical protein
MLLICHYTMMTFMCNEHMIQLTYVLFDCGRIHKEILCIFGAYTIKKGF